jgi:hypothetical protein
MATKIDPNVYALSISLSLESAAAFDTLDDFGEKITDIEHELTSAAQKSLQSINQLTAEAVKSIEDISQAFTKVDSTTIKIHTNLVDAGKELQDQFDLGEDQLDNVEDLHKLMEKINKIYIDMGKELKVPYESERLFLKGTEQIVDMVKAKNDAHREQNTLLGNDVQASQLMNKQLMNMNGNVRNNEMAWRKASRAASQTWGWIKKIDADTEKFVTTNYRAYGSQQQLLQGARNLSMENGIFYENAVEAYAVLGNLKVPREEMDKYAKTIATANRTTGVGIQQMGQYVNSLRVAGMSADQTERHVVRMTEAMRKFGLNAHDVNALMSESAISAKTAARNFGGGAEVLEKWEKSRLVMASFARATGQSADELASFENWILNDISAMERFKALTNTTEAGVDGYRLAMLRAGIETNKQMEEIEKAIASGKATAEERLAMEQSLIKVFYGGNQAAYESARAMGKAATAAHITGRNIEDLDKIAEVAASTLKDQLGEANNTLTGQLKILGSTLWSVFGSVLQLAADAILPFLQVLNWLIKGIASLIGYFKQAITWLEKMIPGFHYVTSAAKFLIGIFIALAVGLIMLVGGIYGFVTAFSSASSIIAGAGKIITTIGQTIVQLATAIGQSIYIILNSIGRGLAALGNQIKPVIGPLIGLSFALLLIAVAAYIFAAAVVLIASAGDAALPILFGMVTAIIILLTAIVLLAQFMKDPITIGAVIILGLVLLAAGVAALFMGMGLRLAAEAIVLMSGVLSFEMIAMIFGLGAALGFMGLMGITATPGILLVSIAMMFLAVAVTMLGLGFAVIARAFGEFLGSIGGENFVQLAITFLAAGAAFFAAAVLTAMAAGIFMVAAPLMIIAALLLSAAVTILFPVAGLLVAVAAMLLFGATATLAASIVLLGTAIILAIATVLLGITSVLLIEAAGTLVTAGAILIIAGTIIGMGAVAIGSGGVLLTAAAGILMVAGPALMVAGVLLGFGLSMLEGSSVKMLNIGVRISTGGTMLYAGALSIVMAAKLLATSGNELNAGIGVISGFMPKMGNTVDQLSEFASLMRKSAIELATAGGYLIPASFAIYIGMRWLESSVDRFATTAGQVIRIAKSISLLAQSFNQLRGVPLGLLKELASQSAAAMPDLMSLGDQLTVASQKLDAGVNQFEGPANRLISIMERLGQSVNKFGEGLELSDNVGVLTDKLDRYATLLENTSQRIETAVRSKAVPAMKAAEEAGLEETIKSEAISTIQVMYDDNDAGSDRDELLEISIKQTALLESLDGRLAEMQTNRGELTEILTLLRSYLPNMNKGDSALGSEFNSWAK